MAAAPVAKATGALRTIGEVASDTGVPQHVLRFWETRFPQLRPLQRAGGRRYYRPDDVALVRRIASLLEREGYTIRGARQLLAAGKKAGPALPAPVPVPTAATGATATVDALRLIRDRLAAALAADERQA